MTNSSPDRMPDDLVPIAERLREERPRPSGAVLDRIKLRALAGRPRRRLERPRRVLAGSRVALVAVLAVGLLMSGAGATLAVSGLSGSGSAGSAQYQRLPSGTEGTQSLGGGESGNGSGVAPSEGTGGSEGVQAARQVGTSSGRQSLPFTGLAAIPLLLVGMALLGGGLVVRRDRRQLRRT
jgi:hypothetical protein